MRDRFAGQKSQLPWTRGFIDAGNLARLMIGKSRLSTIPYTCINGACADASCSDGGIACVDLGTEQDGGTVPSDGGPDVDAGPSCSDGVTNGVETDVDCGGSCPPCEPGQWCAFGGDCLPLANASVFCSANVCTLGPCDPGFADCDGDPSNGCEKNITNDANNCGSCGAVCPGCPGVCFNSVCGLVDCTSGFADCDGLSSNCCETDIANDPDNCGACGFPCGQGQSCVNGTCQ